MFLVARRGKNVIARLYYLSEPKFWRQWMGCAGAGADLAGHDHAVLRHRRDRECGPKRRALPMKEKLIRDYVPWRAKQKGDVLDTRTADPAEMKGLLIAKLQEEVAELVAAKTDRELVDELGDVFEVATELRNMMGRHLVDGARTSKALSHGRFDKRLVLKLPEPR
jgi:predicted house-cleaning noncanonical NTP pyrophosphatase (MazG superfamily)